MGVFDHDNIMTLKPRMCVLAFTGLDYIPILDSTFIKYSIINFFGKQMLVTLTLMDSATSIVSFNTSLHRYSRHSFATVSSFHH